MQTDATATARHANDYRHRLGSDYSLSDAMDEEYLDTEAVEEAERQRISAEMARWYGID